MCRDLRRRAALHDETASILHHAALEGEAEASVGPSALRYQCTQHRIRSLECSARAMALEQDGGSGPFRSGGDGWW